MLFTSEVDVLTTDIVANEKKQTLKIALGIIEDVSILFPAGCHGMVHCTVLHHEHQIFPSTNSMYLTGDGTPIEWRDYYECYQLPHELKIVAWGDGCTYDHRIIVRVAILPRKAIVATAISDSLKNIVSFLNPARIFTAPKGS